MHACSRVAAVGSILDSSRTCWNHTNAYNRMENFCVELLQAADFGPRTSLKVVDQIRHKLKGGKLKNGEQIRSELKQSILELLRTQGGNTDLQLGDTQPGVILVVGVNGGGKTTTIGKLAHKFNSEGVKVSFENVVLQELPYGSAVLLGSQCARVLLSVLLSVRGLIIFCQSAVPCNVLCPLHAPKVPVLLAES